jgi:hypothetical protein
MMRIGSRKKGSRMSLIWPKCGMKHMCEENKGCIITNLEKLHCCVEKK